ncbi:rhamnan synthesis F family protein [Mesorhizobium sp. ES1-1]|uniref:rhamnan synthesis F family protein n=1 Tax=Mesorhizobium sp. ES1-1 TaxID=2876629 RepID=UPI001CCC0352|nr:rhamnan synthesis F family protein [Mesorhizobium sp. ES1-1]MBZ9674408.1 hypothetical protein [Mesorhizobium sp. ES1-1]
MNEIGNPQNENENAAEWPLTLTDVGDRPFRLRRPQGRKKRLRRLFSSFEKAALRFSRKVEAWKLALIDVNERRSGARGRCRRVFHGATHCDGGSVALYAHFSRYSGISEMVVGQLREYRRLGFRIVFVSASPTFDDTDFEVIEDIVETAIHRRNFGLDFGSWVDALSLVPEIADQATELLLVNDSVLGPLCPLDQTLAKMRAGGEGLFGMTDSIEYEPHLQSYFLLARGRAAVADTVSFLRTTPLSITKWHVIKRFEIALSVHMRALGHRVAALWGYEEIENKLLESEEDVAALFAALPGNRAPPTGIGWQLALRRQLLDLPLNPTHYFAGILVQRSGFPFVKRELVLLNPQRIPQAVNWRALIPHGSPTSIQVIEEHLAAYERPLRVPRPKSGKASILLARTPASEKPAEREIAPPPWRYTLASAWARTNESALHSMEESTVTADAVLNRIARSPLVLSFSHDDYASNCGGVQNVIHAEQLAFAEHGIGYLHLSPANPMSLLAEYRSLTTLAVRLDGVFLGLASIDVIFEVSKILGQQNAFLTIIVHHFSGLAPEYVQAIHEASKSPQLLFWLHDFGSLCDSSALLRNDIAFCGGPEVASASCMICAHGENRPLHLARLEKFFGSVSPTVIAPSEVALDFWKRRMKANVEFSAVIAPASIVPLPAPPITRPTRKRLRIAHLGTRTFHKGWQVFADLADRFIEDGRYEFLQLGADEGLPITAPVRHVLVEVGPGRQAAMVEAVVVEEIDIVVNWSLCFETFSFTTHEAIAGGAFVLTRPDSGNIWQAIRKNAPKQGHAVHTEGELQNLFETGELFDLLAGATRLRHLFTLGGASAEWLLSTSAETRRRSLRGNG